MARQSIAEHVDAQLDESGDELELDLRVDLFRCTCPRCGGEAEHLLTAGGRWDRATKRYVGDAATTRQLFVQDAQLAAARWFARWIAARRLGEWLLGPDGTPCFTAGFIGGRRSGKSDLSTKVAVIFATTFPGAVVWIVIPEYPDLPEIERALRAQMPQNWYTSTGGGDEALYITLANGSEIDVVSGRDPSKLKRGRSDLTVIHEAQKQDQAVYAMVAPAGADEGGLVLIVANPPDTAKGEWVADFVERARAGVTDEVYFEFEAKRNPHVKLEALLALRKKLDERTYRREIEGVFLPRNDVVMYAFSSSEAAGNIRQIGRGEDGRELQDVTLDFTERRLGSPFRVVHGMDFQGRPYQAAVALKMFRDPEEPGGDPLVWAVDDVEVERGNEDDLVDALEVRGYTGADAVIPDATGAFQDSDRTKGHSSWDTLRARGWRKLYYPVEGSKANPQPKTERLVVANSLLRAASGKRRLFIAPHCRYLLRALRLWEMRHGIPHWRSDYAHIIDALTYALYRLFPRRAPPESGGLAIAVKRPAKGGWETVR